MTDIQKEANEVWNYVVCLNLFSAVVPEVKTTEINEITANVREFLTKSEEEIRERLSEVKNGIGKILNLIVERYPLKKDINTVATQWNNIFKDKKGKDIFSYGLHYGWLHELIDLKRLVGYDYFPYHFTVGLGANKGHFGIEEEFLLKDAFNALIKAEYYFDMLNQYAAKKASEEHISSEFSKDEYTQMTDIKYEVSAYSRITIISFYAFIECFVNSIGYDYFLRNSHRLDEKEKELLQGLKNGRYLPLKTKIEKYTALIGGDSKRIILSDKSQAQEPFITFFNQYEDLRNSSVHHSPMKRRIWLKPADWIEMAREFSKISINVGIAFWRSCYGNNPPMYIGKLDYDLHYRLAKERFDSIRNVKISL